MPVYSAAAADVATHTVEIFTGPAPTAEGEDFGLFFAGDVQASDAVLLWLEEQGVTLDDPDVYALVVPIGEGQNNRAAAVLPIAPTAAPTPELVAEQTAARRVGRPSIAEDGRTARIPVTLPLSVVARLDALAAGAGGNRSDLLRQYILAGLTQELVDIVAGPIGDMPHADHLAAAIVAGDVAPTPGSIDEWMSRQTAPRPGGDDCIPIARRICAAVAAHPGVFGDATTLQQRLQELQAVLQLWLDGWSEGTLRVREAVPAWRANVAQRSITPHGPLVNPAADETVTRAERETSAARGEVDRIRAQCDRAANLLHLAQLAAGVREY